MTTISRRLGRSPGFVRHTFERFQAAGLVEQGDAGWELTWEGKIVALAFPAEADLAERIAA